MSSRGQHTKRTVVTVAIALGSIALAVGAFLVDPRRAAEVAGTVVFKDIVRGLGIVLALGVAAAFRVLMDKGAPVRGRRKNRDGGNGSKGGSHRSVPGQGGVTSSPRDSQE